MTIAKSLVLFAMAAGVLTVTPGLDTVLVVRSRLSAGRPEAFAAAAGVALGCLIWGIAVAVGLGAVLAAAPRLYSALRWCGAIYLVLTGAMLLVRPRKALPIDPWGGGRRGRVPSYLARGLLTNLLNPKVGLFYLSFLPQFVPSGVQAGPFMVLLTVVHAAIGLAWLSLLVASMGLVERFVLRPGVLPWLDRITGGIFIGFGLKLALDRA